ncbi:M48 family metalloprotease, partial [Spirochaetota bacterium]
CIGFVFTFAGLFIASFFHYHIIVRLGYTSIAAIPSLPVIGLVLFLYNFITTPLLNVISRYHERQADIGAVVKTGNKKDFIHALTILQESNLADPEPNRAVEIMFYSHPPISKRVQHINAHSSA